MIVGSRGGGGGRSYALIRPMLVAAGRNEKTRRIGQYDRYLHTAAASAGRRVVASIPAGWIRCCAFRGCGFSFSATQGAKGGVQPQQAGAAEPITSST